MTTATKPKAVKGTAVPVVVEPEVALSAIADNIRDEFGKGVEASFAIGRLLGEARALFPGDTEFGQWFASAELPFTRQTAYRLQWASAHEEEVRGRIADALGSQRDIGVVTAAKELQAGPPKAKDPIVAEADEVDPAYAALRAASFAIVGTEDAPTNAFLTMHAEDMTKSAAFIKAIVEAYQAARAERS